MYSQTNKSSSSSSSSSTTNSNLTSNSNSSISSNSGSLSSSQDSGGNKRTLGNSISNSKSTSTTNLLERKVSKSSLVEEMNTVFQRLDLRRPSFAQPSYHEDGPNGADITYTNNNNNNNNNNNSRDIGSSGSNIVSPINEHSSMTSSSNSSMSVNRVHDSIDIVVIGDEGVNKAKFISSFLGNGIEHDPMTEVSCCRPVMIKSGTYNVNMHSNVGLEEFWGINDIYNRQGHGFIFVYNINSRESFNMFSAVRNKILFDKGTENVLMAMVGIHHSGEETATEHHSIVDAGSMASTSSTASEDREIPFAEAKRMADMYSCSLIELTSFDDVDSDINGCVSDLLHRITNSNASHLNTTNSNANNSNASSGGVGSAVNLQTTEVMILGDLFVGKTQFLQRCLTNPFSKSYRETVEWSRNIVQKKIDDSRFFINMVDTRGLLIDEHLTRERLVATQGFIFMYSITSRNSFNILESLRKKVLSCKTATKLPKILIANKSDCQMLARQVKTEEGKELAARWGCPFYEISTQTADDEDLQKILQQLLTDMQKMNNNTEVGDFKKEGYLMKEGKKLKSMSRYYFKIKRGCLYYCKNQAHTKNIKSMELSDSIQVQVLNNSNEKKDIWPFSLVSGGKHMNLIASSESDRDQWITSIKINCYVNEFIGNIMEDVVSSMVTEVAHQSQLQQNTHKRSDSIKNTSSSSNSPISMSPDTLSSPFLSPSPPSDSSLGDSPPSSSSSMGSSGGGVGFSSSHTQNQLLQKELQQTIHHQFHNQSSNTKDTSHINGGMPPSPLKKNSAAQSLLQRTTSFTKSKFH